MDLYEANLGKRAWLIVSSDSSEPNEFVSNPLFVLDHLSNLDELRDCLVVYAPNSDDDYKICYFSLNGLMEIGKLDIPPQFHDLLTDYVDDVDGLLCMLFDGVNVAVFNPVLQKWNIPSEIPELPVEDETHSCFGFGKDVDGDYKILRVRERIQARKKKGREMAVFSCSSSTWSVTCRMFENNLRSSSHGKCIEGVIYFLCSVVHNSKEQVSNWEHEKLVISAINLSDLSDTQVELPRRAGDEKASHVYLFPLHDHLGLVQLIQEPGCTGNRTCREIWSMQNPGDWSVMFTLSSEDFSCLKRYLPLRNELVMVEDQVDGSFLFYLLDANNERKLEKKLEVHTNDANAVDTCLASLVSPSLVSSS